MNTNKYFPLRKLTGNAIPVKSLSVVTTSKLFKPYQAAVQLVSKSNIAETITDSRYLGFFPSLEIDNQSVVPAEGAARLPLPPDFSLPFGDGPLNSISALTTLAYDSQNDVSRKLSLTIEIELDLSGYDTPPLVGGICYGGYPYLPYCINESGESTANYGLPREISLIAASGQQDFIDSEFTVTKQEIISHSAFHYLCIDPVKTNLLILKLSDLPYVLQGAVLQTIGPSSYNVRSIEEVYAFIIPYLYVFEYQESTRYSSIVPTGVLASIQQPRPSTYHYQTIRTELRSYFDSEFVFPYNNYTGPYTNYVGKPSYAFFSASLLDGKERTYSFGEKPNIIKLQECYISNMLAPGDKVTLFFEQGEEFDRCIAGIKILFPFIPRQISQGDLSKLTQL